MSASDGIANGDVGRGICPAGFGTGVATTVVLVSLPLLATSCFALMCVARTRGVVGVFKSS